MQRLADGCGDAGTRWNQGRRSVFDSDPTPFFRPFFRLTELGSLRLISHVTKSGRSGLTARRWGMLGAGLGEGDGGDIYVYAMTSCV